jgi:Asp-tRNA(Asn)/Glu-tRNA(Gln) amidotransferase A subunit family amidase
MALGRCTVFFSRRRALARAAQIRGAFDKVWECGYVVVAPTCVYPAPRLDERRGLNIIACTVAGNIADATGLSIPFGHFADGLPRALQLMGPPGSERTLLDLADRLLNLTARDHLR